MPITTTTSTISDQYLTDIADAIRSKNGSSDTYTPPQMAIAINNLDTGGGGGASNYVTGTFTVGDSSGKTESVNIPYTGSGYPLAGIVHVEGGVYNNTETGQADWYSSFKRYSVGFFSFVKSITTSAPTYDTSGTQNSATVSDIYKNSTTSATTYSRSSSMSTSFFSTTIPAGGSSGIMCVRLSSSTTLAYKITGGTTSTYGLHPGITYRYHIIYSS